MKFQVRCQVIHFSLPDAPGVVALAAVVEAEGGGGDADEGGGEGGAAEEVCGGWVAG